MKTWYWLLACAAFVGISFAMGKSMAQAPADPLDLAIDEQKANARYLRELANAKPDLQSIAKKRVEVARRNVEANFQEFATGRSTTAESFFDAQRKLRDAE